MRSLKRVLLGALLVALGLNLVPGSPATAATGGPVILMGIDAEDDGPNGHGPIEVYRDVVNTLRSQTANGGSGILVIGGGKAAGDDVTRFWDQIAILTGEPTTYVNGAANIAARSFAGFRIVAVASSVGETPFGGLTQDENNALATRQAAVADHVNAGGGLLGFSQTKLTNPYAYLSAVGGFTTNINVDYDDITPTAAGGTVGITNALDVCCWHDEYVSFPSFLGVLATNVNTTLPAAIGGANVTVPTNISLTPPSATNPVGTQHTVTATVVDGQGAPFPGQTVAFTVTGANAGAVGTCLPPSCTTDANGQVSFTYTGTNVGDDTITACFMLQNAKKCASVTKSWFSPARISINDVTVDEGDTGLAPPTLATFTVSLNQPAPAGGVTVLASTANGTAVAPADYLARANSPVSFAAGEQTRPFTVQVRGDLINEPDETFFVNLSSPTNATIADPQGVGTIVDDERDGAFSCRASSLRLVGIETAVANSPDSPCLDDSQTVLSANLSLGGVGVRSGTLNARTNQTPDNLESSAPSTGDNAVATASVERATVGVFPLIGIAATAIQSQARVQCTYGPSGLKPTFTSSSTIATLRINGALVQVNGSATINLPLGLGSVQINRTVTTPSSVTQQAIRIVLLGLEVVIAEAEADFTGNPCTQ